MEHSWKIDEHQRLSLAYHDLAKLPPSFPIQASHIRSLDASHNRLTCLALLHNCMQLKTLILDENELGSSCGLPHLPSLRYLSVNGNEITDLVAFVNMIQQNCPNLKWLSMLNNDACAAFSQCSVAECSPYRLYVIARIKTLTTLDVTHITERERCAAHAEGPSLTRSFRRHNMSSTWDLIRTSPRPLRGMWVRAAGVYFVCHSGHAVVWAAFLQSLLHSASQGLSATTVALAVVVVADCFCLPPLVYGGALFFGALAGDGAGRSPPPCGVIARGFSRYADALALFWMQWVLVVMGLVPLLVPGFVAALSLCFGFCALAEDGQRSADAALCRSAAIVLRQQQCCRVLRFFTSWSLVVVLIIVVVLLPLAALAEWVELPVESSGRPLLGILAVLTVLTFILPLFEVGKALLYRELCTALNATSLGDEDPQYTPSPCEKQELLSEGWEVLDAGAVPSSPISLG